MYYSLVVVRVFFFYLIFGGKYERLEYQRREHFSRLFGGQYERLEYQSREPWWRLWGGEEGVFQDPMGKENFG